MKNFIKKVDRVEETLLVVLLLVMCVVIFVGTVGRFTNLFVITWAEELARYCMIWIIFLGISVAARKGEHFSVQALDLFLPQKIMNIISIIKTVLVVAFNFFAAYWGIHILKYQMSTGQKTPSLQWPMWSIYLAIPLGLIIMAIRYGMYTYRALKNLKEDKEGGQI